MKQGPLQRVDAVPVAFVEDGAQTDMAQEGLGRGGGGGG
jgi:hypothetical protein